MPETNEKKSCRIPHINSRHNTSLRVRQGGQQQATDFTTTQELKLRAGDMRMARLQISLSKLQHDMEQSNKLIEKLTQEAQMETNFTK